MADMNKFLQFPSPFLKSPLFFPIPLQLSSHHAFSPLHRPLSLSSLIPHLSSPSNSPNFLLISTSQQSDGSLVFKFGDASEVPPAVEVAEIEVELQTETDDYLANSNEIQNDQVVEEIAEKTVVDSVKDQQNPQNLVEDKTAKYNDNVVISDDNTSRSGSDGRGLDSEAALEAEEIEEEESLTYEMIELYVDEALQVIELPPVQLQVEPILDEEVTLENEMSELEIDEAVQVTELPPVQLEGEPILDEEVTLENEMIELDIDEAVQVIELPPVQLQAEPILDEEVTLENELIELDIDEAVQVIELPPAQLQAETIVDEEESLKNEMIEELPPVQLEAEPILDEEVNYVGLPSIPRQDDSPSGHIITDAAFPSLEESVVISETNVNREKISLQTEDISALSLPMASASYPLKFNDAVPSAILQSDDNPESTDISEPAGPVPELSGTASEEAHLNGVQSSTVAISVPSAMASLPEATKVNDAITPSIQLSDADLHKKIFVAADPGSGISAAEKDNLRVEKSAPSLCVVSAAASVAHTAEALAGGDDAYFVCDNWFAVADGVGQWSFGGIDKGLYAQELIQNCERLARESLNSGLNSSKELLQKSAARTESSGAARVLVAHIVDQVLHVANIGDSGFIVVRNGTVFKKSSPMFHEFNFPYAVSFGENPMEAVEEHYVELEDGDIIVTATDGLFDNLYEREIASLVFKAVEDGENVKDIAELLAFQSQEVGRSPHARTPFADAAQAAGHPEFRGGKFDHVTVIVSIVQKV